MMRLWSGLRGETLFLGLGGLFVCLTLQGCGQGAEWPEVRQTVSTYRKDGKSYCKVRTAEVVVIFGCEGEKGPCSTASGGSLSCLKEGQTPRSRMPLEISTCSPGEYDQNPYREVCADGMPGGAEEMAVKANKELSALQTKKKRTAPNMTEELKKEFAQNIQIHAVFGAQAKEDVKREKAVKANTEFSALQTNSKRPAPDIAEEVKRESNENIQIHDSFAAQEKESNDKERKVKSDRSLKAFVQRTAPGMAEEVKRESNENIQIHDAFAAQEKESKDKERKVKSDRSLKAFVQRTAPDMAEEVKRESNENIQIHDAFAAQERESKDKERKVKSDRRLKA